MSDVNSVLLRGRLGADPEITYLPSETAKVTISIAVNRSYGKKKKTDWFDIVFFGTRAEAINEHFEKGKVIIVRGILAADTWEDNDGNNRKKIYVLGEQFWFGSGNGNGNGNGGTKKTTSKSKKSKKPVAEDLDFDDDEFDDEEEEKPKKTRRKKPEVDLEDEDDDEDDLL